MKIQGKTINGPNVEYVIIPRGEDDQIVFHAQGVLGMEDFYNLVPEPVAPKIWHGDGQITSDYKDEKYKMKLVEFGLRRSQYIILKSLSATPGLEWDTVDLNNPETWGNLDKELKDSGFSDFEINRIKNGCYNANGLNEERMEEARKRFLATRQEAQGK
jgi:hypothetical protein